MFNAYEGIPEDDQFPFLCPTDDRFETCDWCNRPFNITEMIPEEAGMWICSECFDKQCEHYWDVKNKP